jgi:tetraacyldisaccharide 4'-kinase
LGRRHPIRFTPQEIARAADETRLLAAHVGPEVPIVVSRDKRAGLDWLRRRLDVDVVLVDDALQTAGLPVDRHLVLLDWERPFGNGHLLPAGRLREPPAALQRAAALLFTRARDGRPPRDPLWERLAAGLFVAVEEFAGLRTPAGDPVDPARLAGEGVALLCGLGRPQAFEALGRELAARHGFDVRRAVRVGDHAPVEHELRRLADKLSGLGCTHVLVTEKDWLRLPPASQWNEPLLVVEQRLVIRDLGRLLECLLPAQGAAST